MKTQTLFKKILTIRSDFPIFTHAVHKNRLLCYLDNAATTHKPQSVIDGMVHFYSQDNATVGRAIYTSGERATSLYEAARETVQHFIGAQNASEIVFTRGATEGINAIAHAWAAHCLHAGDEIVLTELEHHANLLPWQRVSQQTGAVIKFIPIHADGSLDYTDLDTIITHKTKLVATTHVSNALGTTVDIDRIITRARHVGARILIDASQSAPHQRINVTTLDPDFLVFSGHKMLGPTGIGVLYVKKSVHHELVPYQCGGGMVFNATWQTASWLKMPHLLEAGTPAIAQAIGLASAISYLEQIDFKELAIHEAALCSRLIDGLLKLLPIRILGPIAQLRTQGHLVSFVVNGLHAHDVAAYLDHKGICVRAGHHCAQPLAQTLGIEASVRVSFYLYNTQQEVDFLLETLTQIISHLPDMK
ncbi:MAG: SufS family cysteine desulfurase [Candidatus Dependentiae bacterium]|nr:SufS family cysteine desulfurase [Candidatus Dependentiae bacterium]